MVVYDETTVRGLAAAEIQLTTLLGLHGRFFFSKRLIIFRFMMPDGNGNRFSDYHFHRSIMFDVSLNFSELW